MTTSGDFGTKAGGPVDELARLGAALDDQLRSREQLETSRAQLTMAQHLAKLGSWSWMPGGQTVWSDEMFRILDMATGGALVSLDQLADLIHPTDRDRVVAVLLGADERRVPFDLDCRIARSDGSERWITLIGEPSDDSRGVRWEGCCQDITERKDAEVLHGQIEMDLRNQEQILGSIARGEPLDVTLNALCVMFESRHQNSKCTILEVDPVAGVLRHAAGRSLPAAYCDAIDGLRVQRGNGACGNAAATNELTIVEDTFTDPLTADFLDLCHAHNLRAVWSTPLTDNSGAVIGTFAVYHPTIHRPTPAEIQGLQAAASLAALAIERHRTEMALTAAARIDPLTQLPNRASFLDHLSRRMAETNAEVAVLFLDLDRFKWINDSLGHQAGDRVLIEVAGRLLDVTGEGEVLARFGGDEFTLLLNRSDPDHVNEAANRIDAALLEPFVIDGGEFFLSTSTGIAVNDHETDAAGLVRDADAAMYVAKERGRARRATYDAGLRERAIDRVTLEAELRRAIGRDEIVLHYQPLVDLRSGEWTMVEALVRWQHPTRGLLGPDEFIPLAEETGLILPLGGFVIERAVAYAAELAAGGAPIAMAVNLSVVQLTDPSIAQLVEGLLQRYGLRPDMLVIEVTETAVMEQLDLAHATLERLFTIGVRVFIDDFGTGYSSIARLGDLPVVGVKIDRHFATLFNDQVDNDQVFAAIANLAHAFKLQVVAEGIENQQMLDRASAIGCDLAQGFHLARPMAEDDLLAVLRQRAPRPTRTSD